MEEDIVLEKHFRLIVESLKQIVENIIVEPDENETFFSGREEKEPSKND